MDGRKTVTRESNPRQNANFLSKILFIFACTTFRKGLRKSFEEKDIYETAKDFGATTLGNRLEKEWKKEKRKRNPGLVIPLCKIFGLNFICWGIVYFSIGTCLTMAKPLLKGKLISYFGRNQTEISETQAYYYSGSLCICVVFGTLMYHSYAFGIHQIILKVKIAISGLIYRKALRLSSVFMSKDASGQAITLITKDIDTFDLAMFLLHKLWVGTIQILIMIYIMYVQIGVSALVGATALLLPLPIQGYIGKKISNWRLKTAENTDQRVRKTQEMLTAIRTIKMYTWELFFEKTIATLRKKEIFNLRILLYMKAVILSIGLLNAKFGLYFCVITYVILGNHITAEKAFVVTGCFSSLQSMVTIYIPLAIAQLADLNASLQRISKFLSLEEVGENVTPLSISDKDTKIYIRGATVKLEHGDLLLHNINIELHSGLTTITGTIGAGKSTLLKLILGDVNKASGSVEITGNISYASQEPWVFPGSIKQNIVFNQKFDERRYQNVIQVCALQRDFEALPLGDRTCVTDKGLNLSRGQKTRINLARAVYKVANIYLLDDCLSSVDGQVGKHIFYELKNFFKYNIWVLVTHQELFLRESNNIVILNEGCLKFNGSYQNLKNLENEEFKFILSRGGNVVDYKEVDCEIIENIDKSAELVNEKNENIYAETVKEGKVSTQVYCDYLKAGGGVKWFLFVMALAVLAQGVLSWSDYFVSFWVDMEQEMSGFRYNQTTDSDEYKTLEQSHKNVMILYSFVIIAAATFTLARAFAFFYFSSKASNNIHKLILTNIINASMTFFNENLSGNVLNRLSRDLAIIDEQMPQTIFHFLRVILMLISTLIVVSTVNPVFLIPSGLFLIILYFARNLYIPTGRSIRRLEGSTRSPVIGHFNATLEGLTTIRANSAQEILKNEFDKYQDVYNSVRYMHIATTEAFSFYLDVLSDVYIMSIILSFLFFPTDTLVGRVGLAITQAFSLTRYLQWGVRQWAELENHMTSSERILEYRNIKLEDKSGDGVKNWPNNGKIIFRDVSVQYSHSESVLKNINFTIEAKQKIGIVGRTGAGKTTIISALYRLYNYDGIILIDDVDINTVVIGVLRKNISIIPQDPVLFTGTVRNNLDPHGEYSDEKLWKALEEVDMKKMVPKLSTTINEGGSNFSIGQRQLICLARALLRNNTVLVLDEATANMDPQTDALIQKTIRQRFINCTVITIAHRLNTIMDSDKVLVMDFGKVIEYDCPQVLLENKEGVFYSMVKNVGLIK